MIGYVQSRGRARSKASTFIVMVEETDSAQLMRYKAFLEQEPELKAMYQSREDDILVDLVDEDDIHPADLAQRERHVIASSGAVISYDNALNLLDRLCALIPHDTFTPPHTPKYSGDFEATVQLPSSLPLAQTDLRYQGPPKRTKKEAKRAVAFMAAKRLRELDVFDQFLLPVSNAPKGNEDSDGTPLLDINNVPEIMKVSVKDPWTWSQNLWIHSIFIGERRVAGLVTGTNLFPVQLEGGPSPVRTSGGELVRLDGEQDGIIQRELMHRFTKEAIWYRITGSPINLPLNLCLVPIADTNQPDFPAIHRLLASPRGESSWDGVGKTDYGRLMVTNVNLTGQFYLLQNIREDLSPVSVPPEGSTEAGFATYRDYWVHKWTGKPGSRKRPPNIPESGPLLELSPFPRSQRSGVFPPPSLTHGSHVLFPQGCCRWIEISEDVREALHILPALHRRMTDIYRIRRARLSLSLPPIGDEVLLEALTLPCCGAKYRYLCIVQRSQCRLLTFLPAISGWRPSGTPCSSCVPLFTCSTSTQTDTKGSCLPCVRTACRTVFFSPAPKKTILRRSSPAKRTT
jgi:endoribonuclease Dicer